MIISLGNPKYIDAKIDDILLQLSTIEHGTQITLDFSSIDYLRPDTVIQCLVISRKINNLSGQKVRWIGLKGGAAAYLEKIDISKVDFVEVALPFWRSRSHADVMPLELVSTPQELSKVISNTKDYLTKWFPEKTKGNTFCRDVSTMVMEIVNNSLDHSELGTNNDPLCYYTMQKENPKAGDNSRVIIAFGDAGIGIKQSLSCKPNLLFDNLSDLSALKTAFFRGYSRRDSGIGGFGFKAVNNALKENNGHITMRSGSASFQYDLKTQTRRYRRHQETLNGTQAVLLL